MESENFLLKLAEESPEKFGGTILIDAMYDNPNYWLRISLLRAALGTKSGREIGLLGEYSNASCRATLNRLGITEIIRFHDLPIDTKKADDYAHALLAKTRKPDDILSWRLPYDIPAATVYDGILKRQRLAVVDVKRKDFRPLAERALRSIERANALVSGHDFKLVTISHPYDFTWGSIGWIALSKGIDVVVPFGLFGVPRFCHARKPEHLTDYYDRPTGQEIDALPPRQAAALQEIGATYLRSRLTGKADDLASIYAFQHSSEKVSREEIVARFGWDADKPIVAVYAANWFDWPHQLGMVEFRDYVDWMQATLETARSVTSVNWLFKPHPCEKWFGGAALQSILEPMGIGNHVRIGEIDWNNTCVMNAINALVTYHGTAGVEFAALGKPVLLPDRGKFHDCGFALLSSSRADYLANLSRPWWKDINLDEAKRRAEIFAGWWFCVPDWQKGFLLEDDARQNKIYDGMVALFTDHPDAFRREIENLTLWYRNGHPFSHTFKMKRASTYKLSNV